MPLTDTRVRQLKHTGKPTGDKYTDGRALHLLVKPAGKYWRMSYRFDGKQRTLALGVYPIVTLAKARHLRDQAHQLLSEGVDPVEAKRRDKAAKESAAKHSFEAVARDLLKLRASRLAPSTIRKNTAWLEKNVFPEIGMMPISKIEPRDVLVMLRKIEARGAIESTHKIRQLCGQVFRLAVASGLASRDVTFDLRDALPAIPEVHYAAITEPKQAAALMRSISNYSGHPYSRAALKLAPLFFVRPGVLRAAEWSEFDLDRGVSPICYRERFSAHAKASGMDPVHLAAAMGHISAESQGKYHAYRGKAKGRISPRSLFTAVSAPTPIKTARSPMSRFKMASANKARSNSKRT